MVAIAGRNATASEYLNWYAQEGSLSYYPSKIISTFHTFTTNGFKVKQGHLKPQRLCAPLQLAFDPE